MVEVTQEVRAAADTLAHRICGCATTEQHKADIAAILEYRQAAFNAGRASVLAELESPTEVMVTISEPDMSGDFEGDVWFGHPEKRTLGTHIWRAGTWHRLPSEVDAVISLLAKARKQRDAAIEGLVLAVSALERGTHQDFQDETRQEITAMIGAYKEAL